MLIVYEDDNAMEEAEHEKGYKVDGFPAYFHSGLTPPMSRVVQRRYLSRFEERDTKPLPPPKAEVAIVEKEIQHLVTKFSAGKGKQKRTGGESSSTKDKIIEEVEEEIIDYEPWMGEGGVFTIDDAKIYPECWLSKSEMKEIDEAKRSVEEDRRRKEQEALRAAKEKEEEEKQKQIAKAEKKKKKKDKKKKKHEEEAAAAAAVEQKIKVSLTDDIIIDEVTAAAMTINMNQGIGGDEDLLFFGGDDMFDLDPNEDISDLLG
jgi:transcription initiation factor TFIID subunit 7